MPNPNANRSLISFLTCSVGSSLPKNGNYLHTS
jgi:hypothetical protein